MYVTGVLVPPAVVTVTATGPAWSAAGAVAVHSREPQEWRVAGRPGAVAVHSREPQEWRVAGRPPKE
ncbi:hypothetical protein BU198_00480, partial [Streptomyces sp. CBMA156]|nr:hypothetical protein [Streptomyces sp. CBMA156]